MVDGLGVAGHHVDSEYREQRAHVDEVIVQANRLLENPDTYNIHQSPEMRSLRHLNLDSNHMFLMLKRQLGKYYEEKQTQKSTLHPGKSDKWKEILYASLLRALMELTFAADKDHQLAGLNHIYKWYLDKTRIELPQLKISKGTVVTPRAKTTVISQDNTMKGRRERMEVRRMDAVRPIESRSPSPTRASPTLERSEQLFAPKALSDSYEEDKFSAVFLDSKLKEREDARTSQVHHKLMAQWATARSRLDERLLAKSEMNTVKPRVITATAIPSDDSSDGEEVSPKLLPMVGKRQPTYIDFRHDRTKSEAPIDLEHIPEDVDPMFRPLSKIERARVVNSSLIHKHSSSGSRNMSPDRLSLSFYAVGQSMQPTSRAFTPAILNTSSVSYEEAEREKKKRTVQIGEIRRKLASRQVPCTFRALSCGLSKPDDLPPHLLNHQFLPAGGEYLTSDPFSTLGKKKKGKKGKKKKK